MSFITERFSCHEDLRDFSNGPNGSPTLSESPPPPASLRFYLAVYSCRDHKKFLPFLLKRGSHLPLCAVDGMGIHVARNSLTPATCGKKKTRRKRCVGIAQHKRHDSFYEMGLTNVR